MDSTGREQRCKNEMADVLLKYNCRLIGELKINEAVYGKVTLDMLKDRKSNIILSQDKIKIVAK